MVKRTTFFFAAIVVAAIAAGLYVTTRQAHAPAENAPGSQSRADRSARSVKHEKAPAVTAKGASIYKYSERTYNLLRKKYPSNMPQASGPLSPGRLNLLTKAIEGSAPPGQQNWPVFKEVISGNAAALRHRLESGFSANATLSTVGPYSAQISLLDMAIKAGHRDIIKMLLQHGANVNPQPLISLNGSTFKVEAPLPIAAGDGEDDVVRQLLQRGANIEQRRGVSTNNQTALDAAVYSENVATVYLLLSHGADVNSVLGPDGAMPPILSTTYPDARIDELRNLLIRYRAKAPSGQ
jgi:hypothetical protein